MITNSAGAKIESALYKPFGEQSEWVLPGNAAPETKGWIGERYDADAGLQYLNARYYDPELSLFLQPDWFEVTKAGVGTNRFSYSHNDPVNRFDPNGNQDAPSSMSEEEKDELERKCPQGCSSGRSYLEDMADVRESSKGLLGEGAKAAGSILLPDVQELTNGDLKGNDALEVVGIIPGGKLIGWGVDVYKAARKVDNAVGDVVTVGKVVCSFEGSTLVLAKSGRKPIRDILPGSDLVWGLDATGQGDWHVVTGQTVATYDHKVFVTIRDHETGAGQTITSNRIHPYFAQIPDGEVVLPASEGFTYDGPHVRGHWIDAGNLKPGYKLLNPDDTWAEVVSVLEQPATLDAWNLTVEDAHSYFVAEKDGDSPVWVHNACTPAKINHIFGNAKHQLDGLVRKFGDPIEAYEAVSAEANRMLMDPKTSSVFKGMANPNGVLPSAGPVLSFGDGVVVQLSGGRIVGNTVEIGSFSGVIRLP